jgi:hypothetical protein
MVNGNKNTKGGIIMKKHVITIGCVVAVLMVFTVSNAFSWGSATHAYIGNKLGAKAGLKDFDEMYGALAPDVFNYTFATYYPYLYGQTHYTAFNLKSVADEKLQKALAYGYVSHNGVWGADVTAHHAGITFGQSEGYIIAKANELALQVGPLLESKGITLTPPVLQEVCHNFVEASVDILMTRLDPKIGAKLLQAGLFRTRSFPTMLVEVYAQGLADSTGMSLEEATQVITTAEGSFRRITILYGLALTEPENVSIELLAENFATFAGTFMAAMGVTLPPGVDLAPLAAFGIQQGITLCENDFAAEIGATVKFVKKNIAAHRKDK